MSDESLTNCTENGGYISDIHGGNGKCHNRKRALIGDKGQRYVVIADFSGVEKPVGYTNNATGGSLMEGAKKWPACTNPRIIDRWTKKCGVCNAPISDTATSCDACHSTDADES